MTNETQKPKWYFYDSKEFPAITKETLKENGFRCKRRLWYRIVNHNILQMVYLRPLGHDRFITFSSDPLFAPFFANYESKRWFASDGIPSFRKFNANTIDCALNHFPFHDVRMRYATKNEVIASQFEQIIDSQVNSIVLHYLKRMMSIEDNLKTSDELRRLERSASRSSGSNLAMEADQVSIHEALFLGRYQFCTELIDLTRRIHLEPMQYRIEHGMCSTPEDLQAAKGFCDRMSKWQDEIRTLAVTGNPELANHELQKVFERNKQLLIAQLGIGRDLEY